VAYEIPGFSFTLVAGENLSSSHFCAVDVEVSTGQVILPTAGGRAIGVIQNKPAEGEAATIVVSGVTKVLIGVGGIIAGNNVTVDDDGTIVQAASGNRCLGIALSTGAEGTLGTVLLLNGGATVAGS
jgi:hypothetical protein